MYLTTITWTLLSNAKYSKLQVCSNFTVTPVNSTTVLISWSPPYTLEGVPILGYNVTITNTTSEENEILLVEDTILPCCTPLSWPFWSWEQLHYHCGTYQWSRSRRTKGIFCTIYSNHFFTQRWVGRFNITIEYFPRNIFTWRKNKYLSWYM